MTTDIDKHTEQQLEVFFRSLEAESGEQSPDLMARVLADAYDEQDLLAAKALEGELTVAPAPRRGFLRNLLDAIGGWPAVAGLATATVAGIWIGYNPPAAFDDLTLALMDSSTGYSTSDATELLQFDDLLADG